MLFRSIFLTILVTTLLFALGACAQTAGVAGSSFSPDSVDAPDGAMMIVIDDPRSERRRRGIVSPGYTSSFAYQDDPALKRAADRIARDHDLTLVNEFATQSVSAAELVKNTQTRTGGAERRSIKSLFSSLQEQGAGVKIAVVDTAIDASHPDLSTSTIKQTNFAGSRGRPGIEEHGTAVVGLIAANPLRPEGVQGFASEADVRVLRACWQPEGKTVGKCNTLTLALALDAAIDLQPQVLNLSLTGRYDRVLEELLAVLLERGTIVIAAYDDQRSAAKRFPASQPGVVYAYGAVDTDVQRFSNEGTVLSAPRHAMSLAPKAGYDLVSGHSIAAPQISALAARLIEGQPEASRQQILTQLTNWLGHRS